jgi:hypothetical protein
MAPPVGFGQRSVDGVTTLQHGARQRGTIMVTTAGLAQKAEVTICRRVDVGGINA